jgi:hypothetical protein
MSHPAPSGQCWSNQIASLPPHGPGPQLQTNTNDTNNNTTPMTNMLTDSPVQSDLSYSINTFTPTESNTQEVYEPSPTPMLQPSSIPPQPYHHDTRPTNNSPIQGTTFQNQTHPNHQFIHYPATTIPPFTTHFYQQPPQEYTPVQHDHTTSFNNITSSNIPTYPSISQQPAASAQLQQMHNVLRIWNPQI